MAELKRQRRLRAPPPPPRNCRRTRPIRCSILLHSSAHTGLEATAQRRRSSAGCRVVMAWGPPICPRHTLFWAGGAQRPASGATHQPRRHPRPRTPTAASVRSAWPPVKLRVWASIQQPVHGGQWPLIWRRKTTSRGYKERQDSQDFRPVPRASCHPIPPLYLIPRPSRPTSPVSLSQARVTRH